MRSFLDADLFGAPLSAHPDPLVAVPLLLLAAVATHLSFRLAPTTTPTTNPTSRILMWVVPIAVLVGGLVYPFPPAILIYWLTSNVWTLVQQQLVYRHLPTPAPPPAPPARTPVAPPRPGAKPIRRRHP